MISSSFVFVFVHIKFIYWSSCHFFFLALWVPCFLSFTLRVCHSTIMTLYFLFCLFGPTVSIILSFLTLDDYRHPICYCFSPVCSYPYLLITFHAIDAHRCLQYLKHIRDTIRFSPVLSQIEMRGYCRSIRCRLGDRAVYVQRVDTKYFSLVCLQN